MALLTTLIVPIPGFSCFHKRTNPYFLFLGFTKMPFQVLFLFAVLFFLSSDKLKYLFLILHHFPLITMLMKFPTWAVAPIITWWFCLHISKCVLTWVILEKLDHPWWCSPPFQSCLFMMCKIFSHPYNSQHHHHLRRRKKDQQLFSFFSASWRRHYDCLALTLIVKSYYETSLPCPNLFI